MATMLVAGCTPTASERSPGTPLPQAAPAVAAAAPAPRRAMTAPRPAAPPAPAAPGGAGWLVDAANGCWLWTHAAPPGVTASWTGACPRGPAEGPGEARFAWTQDGAARATTVTGNFRRGRIEGEGTAVAPGGERYTGGFRDGRGNGRGRILFPNGNTYEGGIVDDRAQGRGVYTFTNGDRYEGDLVANLATGRGVYTWGNGDRYEGGIRDNRPDGQGSYRTQRGLFAGNWNYGCFRDPATGTRVAMWRDIAECP